MGKYIESTKSEIYNYNSKALENANVFQLIEELVNNISETNKIRQKTVRELIDETLTFRLNVFEKLALHFSREAMLAEKNRDLVLNIFDTLTFNPKNLTKNITIKKLNFNSYIKP
ncbi:MAG: hypothetical protein U0354_12195 [Candidatus Sericytochromatia bacterium]